MWATRRLFDWLRSLRARRAQRCGAIIAAVFVAAWSPAGVCTSSQGGKAEPIRIQFLRGHDSATVRGTVTGDAQTEYVFGARKNQRLTVSVIATPPGSISIKARRPAGDDLPLPLRAGRPSSIVLPDDGDYEIWVTRAVQTRGRSRYRLTVTIQ
jgi:hypothetical protein